MSAAGGREDIVQGGYLMAYNRLTSVIVYSRVV